MKLRIIGIMGQMGSGKDFIGDLILEKVGNQGRKLKFADGVNNVVGEFFDLQRSNRSLKARKTRQLVGDSFRSIYKELYGTEDVWVDYLKNRIYKEAGLTYVITDVRYANELQAIIELGGIVLFPLVDEKTRQQRIEKRDDIEIDIVTWAKINNHASEKECTYTYALDNYIHKYGYQFVFIPNDGSASELVELENLIDRILGIENVSTLN